MNWIKEVKACIWEIGINEVEIQKGKFQGENENI